MFFERAVTDIFFVVLHFSDASSKAFAYLNIKATEADIKKCKQTILFLIFPALYVDLSLFMFDREKNNKYHK